MKKIFLYFILPVQLILISFSVYMAWFISEFNGVAVPPEKIRFLVFIFIAFIVCLFQVLYFTWKNTYKTAGQLEQIKTIAKKFRDGSFAQRFSYSGDQSPEIGSLNKSLNNLVSKVEKRLVGMQQKVFEKDAVLSSMNESVVAIDLSENIYLMNKSAKLLFNVTLDQNKPKTLTEVIRVPELYQSLVSAMETGDNIGQNFTIDGTMIGQKEKTIYMHVKSTSIIGRKNKITGSVFVFNNITKIKRLEKHRSNFVGNVSHELKTPLTLIQGFSETLLENDDLPAEDSKKYIGIIHKHSSRLGSLIDDLLSISRLENQEGKTLDFDFGELSLLVKNAISLCKEKAQSKKINLVLNDTSEKFSMKMNFSLLEQALVNLIDNAIKHSDPNSNIEVNLFKESQSLKIEVKDYGQGMDEKHLPHIFERFYRVDKGRSRESGGTGLGLSIVKHVVQIHGGSVSAVSSQGQGSCFTIKI